jgi:hypothetical protein
LLDEEHRDPPRAHGEPHSGVGHSATMLVVVEAHAGWRRGLGYSNCHAPAAALANFVLGKTVHGTTGSPSNGRVLSAKDN